MRTGKLVPYQAILWAYCVPDTVREEGQGSAIGQAPHQILCGYHCMSLYPYQTHEAGSFFRWNSEGLSNA